MESTVNDSTVAANGTAPVPGDTVDWASVCPLKGDGDDEIIHR